jgi:Flp pilus assembly protein TadG
VRRERGSAILEFTLVGIPLVFVVISTFEMARGMWLYHSLAYAAKTGARFAVVRGKGCQAAGNACGISVGDVAGRIAGAATGLPAGTFDVTLESAAGTLECRPLSACLADATAWPPGNANSPGMDIRVTARHEFRSALALFWPGAGTRRIGTALFEAGAFQRIQF